MPRISVEYDNGTVISFEVDSVSIRVDRYGDLHLDTNFRVEDFSRKVEPAQMTDILSRATT